MTDLEHILRLNLEFEGALRVMQARPDSGAIDIARQKLHELAEAFDAWDGANSSSAAVVAAAPVHTVTPVEIKEDEAVGGEEGPLDEPDAYEVPLDGTIVEDDIEAAEYAEPEYEPADEPAPESAPEPEETAAPEPVKIENPTRGDIRANLTLNDKFLFKRELFEGNERELNETLDLISSMGSLEEAEEYIFHDLAWDPDSAVVKEFHGLIYNYFKSIK